MAIYRAQVVLQSFTNDSKDRYTNTFHMVDEISDPATHADAWTPMLEAFYDAWGSYIAPFVLRTASVNWYDLTDAPPRPVQTRTFTFPAPINPTSGLPPEVAACLSYRAAPPNTKRRRGRIFLGPLDPQAMAPGTTSSYPSLLAAFRTAVLAAAVNLAEDSRTMAGYTTGT